ncbi:MAG: hypothetical protein K2N22_04540 [Clostridia bacterium]|nr:hypothetical protein [Clostridia bacterium]
MGNSAKAAVKPNDETDGTAIKYEATSFKQYYNPVEKSQPGDIPYGLLGAVDTGKGICELDQDAKRIDITKKSIGYHQLVGYVAFKATFKVPAMTEYEIEISYSAYVKRGGSASSTAPVGCALFYFGNTFDNPSASDHSSELNFVGYGTASSSGLTPANYVCNSKLDVNTNAAGTFDGQLPLLTINNNTTNEANYTAYFGYYAFCSSASAYVITMNSYLELSDSITVTPIANADDFGLDKTEDDYTGNDIDFTLENWDNARVALTSYTRKKLDGTVETLYTYSNDATETVGGTGSNPLNGTSVIKAVKAGTYTLKFDIYYWCGAVWDSDTNDQTTKTFTFTIKPKEIAKPTIADAQKEKAYTGSAIAFNFSSTLSTADWANYIKELDKNKMTVADNGDKNSVVDKKNKTVEITHVGSYTVKFELADTENTVWADPASTNSGTTVGDYTVGGTKDHTLKITPATLTTALDCNYKPDGNWKWDAGTDDVEIEVTVSGFKLDSDTTDTDADKVTLAYYYKENKDGSVEIPLTGSAVVTNETYGGTAKTITAKITMPDDIKPNTEGYIFGVKPDGTNGANGNYTVKENEATHTFKVESASLDPSTLLWSYLKDGDPSNKTLTQNGKITYETKDVDGKKVAIVFTPQIQISFAGDDNNGAYDYTDFVIIDGSYTGTTAASTVKDGTDKTYTTTITLKIKDGDTEHVFANPNSLTYVTLKDNGRTAEITLTWEIEPKELDLSNVTFEYDDGINGWQVYDPENPPEKTGMSFKTRVTADSKPDGVDSVVCTADGNTKGPGTIKFNFEFELDKNHKAKDDLYTVKYTMQVTGTQVNVNWVTATLKDRDGNDVTDNGVPYQIYVLDVPESDPAYPFIKYRYFKANDDDSKGDEITGGIERVVAAIEDGGLGASSSNLVHVYVEVYLDGMTQENGVDPFVLKTTEKQKDFKVYYVGDSKDVVDLTAGSVTSITYGSNANANDLYNLILRDSKIALSGGFYKVSLFDKSEKNCIAEEIRDGFDFSKLDAGEYKLVFELINGAEEDYIITPTNLTFKVNPVELLVPTIKDGVNFVFNGEEQQLADSLQNFDTTYMQFASNSIHEARNAGGYTVIINIKDEYKGNYIFVLPEPAAAPAKAVVKFALVDDTAADLPELSNNNATASFKWTINKYVLDTTSSNAWNFSKNGASLNLPNWVKALTASAEPSLIINTLYYDTQGNPLTDVELKGGNKLLVAAYIDPTCADAANFEFKNQSVDPMTSLTTSPQTTYTVPQSGAAAFLGNAKEALITTYAGLPLWAWLAIGLAVLILLIIIIAVCAKRRKSKEQREEIKARKQEEKERREEERRMQQERLQAERELAMAKQQAELEKIRAQAQAGMAGAGMATMAMAQQAMPAPQQQMQQQPVQQPVQMQQQAMPTPMQAQMPQAMQMPAQSAGMDSVMLALLQSQAALQAQITEMRATQDASTKAEMEMLKMQMLSGRFGAQQNAGADAQGISAELLGEAIVTAFSKLANGAKPAELPAPETETATASAAYPPDAIVTTTTTVDTTKKTDTATLRREREDSFADVDGFYDSID